MAQGRSRPAWAEIDLAAVAHNAAVLARLVAPAELCAVVKAHGYGHGGPAVARAALAGGRRAPRRGAGRRGRRAARARRHRTGAAAERVRPRRGRAPRCPTGSRRRCTPPRGSPPSARRPPAAGRPVAVHVKVDTGMHRVGVAPEDLRAVAAAVVADPLLQLESIWTHLPVADGDDGGGPRLHGGPARPLRPARRRPGRGRHPRPAAARRQHGGRHRLPRSRYDMVRCGLGLYGYLPGRRGADAFDEQAGGERLRPAMALKARVVAVRTLDAGERPSYGRLRPLPDALARGHRPDRLRRRGAARRSSTAASRSSSAACAVPWPAR